MMFVNGKSRVCKPYKHTSLVFVVIILVVLVSWMLMYCFLPQIFSADFKELPVRYWPRTVVSVSSFSHRVFHMRACLDSVFAQTQVPDRVIVSIPIKFRVTESTKPIECGFFEDCLHDIQSYNESLEFMVQWFSEYMGIPYNYSLSLNTHNNSYLYEFGILTVQFLDEDWGPATKLIGALLLETHPETVIVTLDDDVVYHADTILFLSTHVQDNMSLSFGCEEWNAFGEFISLGGMAHIMDYTTTPRVCQGWLLGWMGVVYHVSSFGPDIWTFLQSLPRSCFFTDDIWLSGYLSRRGVQRVYAPNELKHHKHVRDMTLSLGSIVDTQQKYGHTCARYMFP